MCKMDINDFSTTLKSLIPTKVLFNPDKYKIIYQCLKHINFRNLTSDRASIDTYCLKRCVLRPISATQYTHHRNIHVDYKDVKELNCNQLSINLI